MIGLERFLEAQEKTYSIALQEISNGYKESHWMWYVFPQLKGLGKSPAANFYGINNREEAETFIRHPILGKRLIEISELLLQVPCNDAEEVMGWPDNLKLQSCMTLFNLVSEEPVFEKILDKFFEGKRDLKTEEMLDQV